MYILHDMYAQIHDEVKVVLKLVKSANFYKHTQIKQQLGIMMEMVMMIVSVPLNIYYRDLARSKPEIQVTLTRTE